MADGPKINDVRLGDNGVLEFYDGTAWILYPDVPDDDAPPQALTKDSATTDSAASEDWPR
ncbi:hypothetical protein AB0945_19255 [Streptomyces sp. NPDC005474]|uniref:hypothetical protein n=1 Tax=Streptomyces sp. NPDC005474 TaxID=3154878 RepID=UPI003452A07C